MTDSPAAWMEQLSLECDHNHAILDGIVEKVAKAKKRFVSNSVRAHVRRIGSRALQTARRGLVGNRGHCELMVGGKGQGKTSFLELLGATLKGLRPGEETGAHGADSDSGSQAEGSGNEDSGSKDGGNEDGDSDNEDVEDEPPRVHILHVDIGLDANQHPLTLLATTAGVTLKPVYLRFDGLRAGFQVINKALAKQRASVVLLVDEYHAVYTAAVTEAHKLWQRVIYLCDVRCIMN